jgi:LCP family protein required for cell wall assembly
MLPEEEVVRRRAELEERRKQKKQYRRRQIIFYSLFLVVGIILMVLTARYSYRRGIEGQPVSAVPQERVLVLFLGTDEKLEANVRADTIMLLSLDTKTGAGGVVSIPRDTRVWIPSRQRWDRINAAYAHGGAPMAMEAVSHLLGVPIRYYVHTDFDGFQQMVDLLGGVEITVAKEMKYVDQAQGLEIHLLPGRQVLNGDKALQYVRYRDRLGDVALVDPFKEQYDGRVERQRQFLEALIDKILSPASLTKLPQLVAQTFKIVDTNLPWEQVISLALASSKFSSDLLETAVLPGNSQVMNDAWYWIVNEQKARPIIDTMILGKPQPLKLVVLNGNGRSGIAQEVATRLGDFGYDVVSHGNAEHFNFTETKVLVSAKDASRVEPLADYLGASIQQTEISQGEVTVIIGRDFILQDRSVGI